MANDSHRANVGLIPRSEAALVLAMELSGDNKTDTVNRAIQVYAYLLRVMQEGGSAYVREREGADLSRIKLL